MVFSIVYDDIRNIKKKKQSMILNQLDKLFLFFQINNLNLCNNNK
jgi:hypothetical protein